MSTDVIGSTEGDQMEVNCSNYAMANYDNIGGINCPLQSRSSNITIDNIRYELTAPTFNITYYSIDPWQDDILYWYNSATLTNDQLSAFTQCNPSSRYQWGFSFLGKCSGLRRLCAYSHDYTQVSLYF